MFTPKTWARIETRILESKQEQKSIRRWKTVQVSLIAIFTALAKILVELIK